MANHIHENFASFGRYLSSSVLMQTLVMLTHRFVACGKLPATALNFKCSTTSLRRFLKRSGLSFRRTRAVRRLFLHDGEWTNFTLSLHLALEIFGVTAVMNFDESAWRLVLSADGTVAQDGSEYVKRFMNGDVKAGFTFFASIMANGTKLPLILIVRGKTE
jgi:hypothetical protein